MLHLLWLQGKAPWEGVVWVGRDELTRGLRRESLRKGVEMGKCGSHNPQISQPNGSNDCAKVMFLVNSLIAKQSQNFNDYTVTCLNLLWRCIQFKLF